MREGDDFQTFVNDVKTEIDAISDFPERAESATVRPLGRTDFVASIALTGPQTRTDLHDYAEQIRTRMLRWGGIPKVDIRGFSTREFQIDLRPGALQQFGVSVADIARVVEAASLDLPAGTIEAPSETLLVRVAEERGARLVLVGDTKQHESVERGSALRSLIDSKLVRPERLSKVRRQRSEEHRTAHDRLIERIGHVVGLGRPVHRVVGRVGHLCGGLIVRPATARRGLIVAEPHRSAPHSPACVSTAKGSVLCKERDQNNPSQ